MGRQSALPPEFIEVVSQAYRGARRRGDSDYKAWCAARDAVLRQCPELDEMDAVDVANRIIADLAEP